MNQTNKASKKFQYDVLSPIYKEAGLDFKGNMQYWVSWKKLGEADSLTEAKKFTKHPVLEDKDGSWKKLRISKEY